MSSYGLSSETKKSVKSTVLALRELLEGEFDPDTGDPIPPGGDIARQISRYGILVNNPESLKSENAPEYLTDEEKKKRERICAAIKREIAIFGKLSDNAALRRGMRAFIRQTSYTWINRLLGLRCMEARGLLKDDRGELDFVVTPSDDYGGLPRRAWRIKGKDPAKWQTAKLYDLQCEAIDDACRQLTKEIKVLFDPEHDYGLIWPSAPALNTLLQKIQELDKVATPGPFTSPDFLGWVYQYFQTIEKDLVFEAASKKKKKIEKDDIIPATQIYTEHYMVEYLVQNSLGRFWMEMHPDSKLSAKWAYYVKPPEENPPVERELKKAIDIKLMDPAVGSGHFHLVAFNLLLDMYEEEIQNAGQPGWTDTPSVEDKKDIPAAILEHNLFGIDIDARSIQLASLVLVMKARESGYEGPINHLNLVVANSAPFESEAWYQFIQNLEKGGKHSVARVLAALGIQLKNLDEFGSLLRIEDEMQKIIQEEKKQWISQAEMGPEQDYLFPEMAKPRQEKLPFETAITDETFFDRLGSVIHKELDTFYLKARQDGLAEEAIMAADAERGFDFARLSLQRYDVVYTNPPFMGSKNMGERLKDFVAGTYPQGKRDLYAAFILRCGGLLRENGHLGMVTQQSWMFLKSFKDLRAISQLEYEKGNYYFKGILREKTIKTLAHLGPGAFAEISGVLVNIALFTYCNKMPNEDHRTIILDLRLYSSSSEKERHLPKIISEKPSFEFYALSQSSLLKIPGAMFLYSLPGSVFPVIETGVFAGKYLSSINGSRTGDNEHYLRLFWEVPSSEIGSRWRTYSKGGSPSRWLGNEEVLIDWSDKAVAYYRESSIGRCTEERFWSHPGLSFSKITRGNLTIRYVDHGISDYGGPVLKTRDNETLYALISTLNTHYAAFLSYIFNPSNNTEIGDIYAIPVGNLIEEKKDVLARIAKESIKLKDRFLAIDPISIRFSCYSNSYKSLASFLEHRIQQGEALSCILSASQANAESVVTCNLKLSWEEFLKAGVSEPTGWYPLLMGYDQLPKFPQDITYLPIKLKEYMADHKRISCTPERINHIKEKLHAFYITGSAKRANEKDDEQRQDKKDINNNEVESAYTANFPIPAETFIEEISQKLHIHPISIYHLVEEMREKEGLVCHSELKRYAEDYLSVTILRMLGYQWPKELEMVELLPDWADNDGIIPLTAGLGEASLIDRIRKRFGADFGEEKEASIESEFANIVGKPLEQWLEEDFFARHLKQFKNSPIAWHIVSDPSVVNHEAGQSGKGKKKGGIKKQKPAFSVMVHYHRFVDGDRGYGKLLLLKNKYLEKLMSQTRSELESLRGKGDDPKTFDRIAELDRKLVELEDFRDRLERIQEGKDPESSIFVRWKTSEEQPQGWRPDINDGVKINIAPWERLGMFPVKKIVGKVEMAPD